jgi:hypothetical protein
VTTGLATENAKLMLEGNDIELTGIQDASRMDVVFQPVIVDLKANDGGIVEGVAMVGHRHDRGLHTRTGRCDRLLQIGREGGYTAAAGERIANEGYPFELGHDRTPIERTGEPAFAR